MDRDQQIRETAYRLWEQAGRPQGKELNFWLQAESSYQPDKPAARPGTAFTGHPPALAEGQPRPTSALPGRRAAQNPKG